MAYKIAYIMSRFPHLPETFILREMNELVRQGWDIALYPLIQQKQPVIHHEAKPWLSRIRPLPFLSWHTFIANIRTFFSQPINYATVWLRTIKESRQNPYMLVRSVAILPKAVYAAHKMQQEGINHIHAHYSTHPAFATWVIHQLTGISYSVTVHAHDIFVRRTMLKSKLESASFVAAISEFNRNYLAEKVGERISGKTHIVHCGIEPKIYKPTPLPRKTGGLLEIIHIGSLQPYKGQRYLIEACQHLRENNIPFRCQIIGGGEEKESLTKLINTLGLEFEIILLGNKTQQEVAHLLSTAHCYVQPSIITSAGKMEGIPVALMEAMACQLPVVATSLSGVPELVRPGETGYLVPPEDARAIADALMSIHHDPDRAAILAANGRSFVMQSFELKANVSKLARLFTDVIINNAPIPTQKPLAVLEYQKQP